MKKVLFGTTALVAASIVGSVAQAAEPIKLSVGGMMQQYFAIYDREENPIAAAGLVNQEWTHASIASDTEVHFKGATTLDNGLKVAVVIELEAERTATSTSRNADQQYVTLSGGWGQVRVGEMLNAATVVHNQAPVAGASMADIAQGVFGNFSTNGTAASGTAAGTLSNGQSVTGLVNYITSVDGVNNAGRGSAAIDYISPMFGPFAFGITYTPRAFGRGPANEGATSKDLLGAALVYADKWGPVGIKTDVAYARFEELESTTQAGMAHAVPVGATISYAGFDLGGSYIRILDNVKSTDNATAATSLDGNAWDVGVAYTTGPWKFGYAFYRSSLEGTGGAGGAAGKGKDKISMHNIGGQYTMGPGVVATLNYAYEQMSDEDASTARQVETRKRVTQGLVTGLKLTF
jgi:outer membrane protein OmpU